MSTIGNTPISDRISRERIYEIVSLREDKKDAFAQLVITLWDLLSGKFTGKITLNCSQGSISNIQVSESRKV